MRKALIAFACVGVILLVAGSLALSHGRSDATINPLSEQASDNPVGESPVGEGTTEMPEPVVIPDGGFGIEVLVDGRPLEEYDARGRRYVEAFEGAEYELRISNPLPVRVAVALSVDGLNTIDARRTTAWNASKWVIEPYGTIHISGWQMSSARARRFYFTNERDSYGAKLGQTANLGTISAVFFRERSRVHVPVTPPPGQPIRPLEDERQENSQAPPSSTQSAPSARSGDSSGAARSSKAEAYPGPDDDYAATGIGRSVRHDVTWVNMDLDPRPTAEVAIRYEYRETLVRLGILPRPYKYPDPLRRRERSTGFDDHRYSPEP
jgi:hypothetical protein